MKFVLRDETTMKHEKQWGAIPENNEMDKLIVLLCKADIPFDLAIYSFLILLTMAMRKPRVMKAPGGRTKRRML